MQQVTKVKVREYRGEIIAQIPYELRRQASDLKLGVWDPKLGVWRFRLSPPTANTILSTFSEHLAYCDHHVKNLARIHSEAQQSKFAKDLPEIPNMRTKAWEHQRQAYHFAKELPGVMISVEMGGGKSLVAVGLVTNRTNNRVLILCPKSVITVWPDEFEHSAKHFLICPLQNGSVAARQRQAAEAMKKAQAKHLPFVMVINYESFWREAMWRWLSKQQWDQLIADEIHKTKDPSGAGSKAAAKIQATYKIGLTGTPLPHSPLDAFGQFRVLEPSIFGTNFFRFKQSYANLGGYAGKQVVSFKNQDELAEKMDQISYRVSAEDVLDLPETVHAHRTIPMGSTTAKHYMALDKALYTEIEEGSVTPANAMVKVLRLQQLTSGYLKTDDGDLVQCGTEKRSLLSELLTEIPKQEPAVIFCRFTSDIQNVKEVCGEIGKTCAELSGHANQLRAWQDGEFDHIAVQIRSGGVGISLTRACYCFYYSIGHSLADYLQSLARTHRPGQERTVRYFHLLVEGSVDQKVYKAITQRKEIVDAIIDWYKQQPSFVKEVFDEEAEAI